MTTPTRRGYPNLGHSGSSLWNGSLWLVFASDGRIRSGWSALLFVAIYLALSTLLEVVLTRFLQLEVRARLSPIQVIAQESCDLFAIFSAAWVMARIESRSILSFGYSDEQFARRLAHGFFGGIFSLSCLVGILWKAHLLAFSGLAISGIVAWKYAFEWAFAALLVGIVEESLLRGYLQFTLARGLGFWWAALVLSIAFALWHINNGGESILGLVVVGLGGLVFCLSLWYTRSLWWAIGFHAGWDWGQSYLYGAPDSGELARGHLLASHANGAPLWSGGSTGPEGSLIVVPFLIAIAFIMWLWWGRKPGQVS